MSNRKWVLAGALALISASGAEAQTTPAALPAQAEASTQLPKILPLRERAKVRDGLVKDRLDNLAPKLMRQYGIDMWVLVSREDNQDPVMPTMLSSTSFKLGRLTILAFFDPGAGKPVERFVVSSGGIDFFPGLGDEAKDEENDWKRLAAVIAARNPRKIALNMSSNVSWVDGISHTQYNELVGALSPELKGRVVSAEPLAIAWLETRTPADMEIYKHVMQVSHAITAEGFSGKVIKPGVTTTDDLRWWYRQRLAELGLDTWFQPWPAVFRKGDDEAKRWQHGPYTIEKGDMIRLDFGIDYLGFKTDTQHIAYVLRDGEVDAPAGLKAGLAAANGVQDVLLSQFRTGRTGNEILKAARAEAIKRGLEPRIYSHPIGHYGHGPGPSIGLWGSQEFVANSGEHRLHPNTTFSIELTAKKAVPEWDNQIVSFETEDDAYFDGEVARFIEGRQSKIHLIKPQK